MPEAVVAEMVPLPDASVVVVVVTEKEPVRLVALGVILTVAVVPDIVLEKSHEWAEIAINGKRTAEAIAL